MESQAQARGGGLRRLTDSGLTGSYISDRCLVALNIPVVAEEEHEDMKH